MDDVQLATTHEMTWPPRERPTVVIGTGQRGELTVGLIGFLDIEFEKWLTLSA